jgi:glycosyltransferase involved in cell wall biosynthesis
MSGKRILLVSSAFYPEISPRSYRATELAKEFSRQGNEVTVISKFRDYEYSSFLKEYPVTLKMWQKAVFHKIPVSKKKLISVITRGLSRFLLLFFEYPFIEEMFRVRKMLKYENGYNLMISFAVPYPVHWGVAWSRSSKHLIADTWVADCGDPFMGDVLDTFRKPFYFGFLEKWFCRKADHISIPVESARPGYYSEFHQKINVIPQGFDFDINEYSTTRSISDIPEFAYTGGFLRGIRDPRRMLQLLIKTDLPFKFYVFTDDPGLLNGYIKDLEGKLIVSGYIPRPELMKKLSEMDFLINFDNNTQLNVPSKLIDYAITGRPVFNISQNFNEDGLLEFLKGNYEKRMPLPDPQQYHIKNISKLFLDLLIY